MKYREQRPGHDVSPQAPSRRDHAIAPGKRTLTMGLASRHAAGAAPVQRRAATATAQAAPSRPAAAEAPVEDWMAVALRPDLHQAPILRKSISEAGYAGAELPQAPAQGGGRAMPAAVQAKMEHALGADFASVRIHEGPEAQAMGALAYTQGADIHFAPGQYDPGSQHGQELLGHELTHVVQQGQGRVHAATQAKGTAINDDPALEREADELGARAARGAAGMSARSTTGASLQARPSDAPGVASGPATGAVQLKKGDRDVRNGGDGDRGRKKESRRERDQRRGELKPEEIEQGGAWLTLFAEAERLRGHQQDREQHEVVGRLREQFLEELEQREEELLARAEEIAWPEQRPIFGKEYQDSQRVLGSLNSEPMDVVDAYQHMMGILTAWDEDMTSFVAEEELRRLKESVALQLHAPRQVLLEITQELGSELPKGAFKRQSRESQRKRLLKTARELTAECRDLLRSITVARPGTRQLASLLRNIRDIETSAADWIEERDDSLARGGGSSQGTAKTIPRSQVISDGIATAHVHQAAVAELHRYLNRWSMYDDILAIWSGAGEDRTAPGTSVLHHHANNSFQHNILYLGTVILGVVPGHMQTVARTGVRDVEDKVLARLGGPTVEVALVSDGVYLVVDD